jgi:hypothetical protein
MKNNNRNESIFSLNSLVLHDADEKNIEIINIILQSLVKFLQESSSSNIGIILSSILFPSFMCKLDFYVNHLRYFSMTSNIV